MECAKCGRPFEPSFKQTGRQNTRCEECRKKQAERQAAYRAKKGNPSTAAYQREFNLRRRLQALKAYGGKCDCCGETSWQFLTFDHADGGGAKHRLTIATRGNGFVSWLHANSFPDFIRVLCHNCNSAIGYYGACPHDQME